MKKRTYDKEFKLNAVLMQQSGKSIAQVARDLGIAASTLHQWIVEHKKNGSQSFKGSGNIKSSNEEFYKLKKELADIKLQRDILKKALAIFSKQQK